MGMKERKLAEELQSLRKERIALQGRDRLRHQVAMEKSKIRKARYGGIFSAMKTVGKEIKTTLDAAAKNSKKQGKTRHKSPPFECK
jgi:hypothetical protein